MATRPLALCLPEFRLKTFIKNEHFVLYLRFYRNFSSSEMLGLVGFEFSPHLALFAS